MPMILPYSSLTTLSVVQFLWKKNFNMCSDGPTLTSFKLIFPKLKNLYLEVQLHVVVVTYALPSFAGQLPKADKARIDSLFRKAFRRGFCCHTLSIDELIYAGDDMLFRQMSNDSHCLHLLLPTQRNNKALNSARTRGHNYLLQQIESTLFTNGFINRCFTCFRTCVLFVFKLCIYLLYLQCICICQHTVLMCAFDTDK